MRSKKLGNQGRNDRGRFVTFPNPPKNRPLFHVTACSSIGATIITNRGVEFCIQPGRWRMATTADMHCAVLKECIGRFVPAMRIQHEGA